MIWQNSEAPQQAASGTGNEGGTGVAAAVSEATTAAEGATVPASSVTVPVGDTELTIIVPTPTPPATPSNFAPAKKMVEDGGEAATKLINDLQDISLARIALIVAFTWFAIFIIRKTLPFLAERGPSQTRLYLLGSARLGAVPIIRLFLLTTAIVWIVPLIFNITFQNFLVIAGIVALFERPYRPGDWVKIDGDYGEVQMVGLRAIRLQTAADDMVTVPHDRIWTNTSPMRMTAHAR